MASACTASVQISTRLAPKRSASRPMSTRPPSPASPSTLYTLTAAIEPSPQYMA